MWKSLLKTHQCTPTQTHSASISLSEIHVVRLLRMEGGGGKKKTQFMEYTEMHSCMNNAHTLIMECEDEG